MFGKLFLVLAAGFVLAFTGCQTTKTHIPESTASEAPVVLYPGDVVQITVMGNPDLSMAQKIRQDGKISMPIIGEVKAAGSTPLKLQQELTRLYKPQLQTAEVLVTLNTAGEPITISGAVSTPKQIYLERPTTLLQALMQAGAFGGLGDMKRVHLIRTVSGKQYTQVFDMSGSLKGKPSNAYYLQGGDVIFVPERIF
jgi:polysaccharide export outer membrane protein